MTAKTRAHELDEMNARIKKRQIARRDLDKEIEQLTKERDLALPGLYGFDSMDEFITSLLPHASPALLRDLGARPATAPKRQAATPVTRRKRGRFSDETRDKIKAEMMLDAKSVKQLSAEYGVAESTLMMWKQQWGLTRTRGPKSEPKPKPEAGPVEIITT